MELLWYHLRRTADMEPSYYVGDLNLSFPWPHFSFGLTPCFVGSSRMWVVDTACMGVEADDDDTAMEWVAIPHGRELAAAEYLAFQGIDHSLQRQDIYQE